MTREQLEFKAEPDGSVITVVGKVGEGDYVEWHPGAWTSVVKGSPLIGQPPGNLKFLRIVKRTWLEKTPE